MRRPRTLASPGPQGPFPHKLGACGDLGRCACPQRVCTSCRIFTRAHMAGCTRPAVGVAARTALQAQTVRRCGRWVDVVWTTRSSHLVPLGWRYATPSTHADAGGGQPAAPKPEAVYRRGDMAPTWRQYGTARPNTCAPHSPAGARVTVAGPRAGGRVSGSAGPLDTRKTPVHPARGTPVHQGPEGRGNPPWGPGVACRTLVPGTHPSPALAPAALGVSVSRPVPPARSQAPPTPCPTLV